jgi:hypothetical protein
MAGYTSEEDEAPESCSGRFVGVRPCLVGEGEDPGDGGDTVCDCAMVRVVRWLEKVESEARRDAEERGRNDPLDGGRFSQSVRNE